MFVVAIQRIDSLIKEVMEQEKFKMGPPPPLMTMQTSLPGIVSICDAINNLIMSTENLITF